MKPTYIIAPLLLLALFGYFFWKDHEVSTIRERERIAVETAAAEKARIEKETTERRAREDAAKRVAEREAEEKAKEEKRIADWNTATAAIATDTEAHRELVKKRTTEIAALEKRLSDLHTETARLTRENFAIVRANETQHIQRRNIEIETQRILEKLLKEVAPK